MIRFSCDSQLKDEVVALFLLLTDGIFETGAYGVPSKSQNPTVLAVKMVHLVPNVQTLAGHAIGTIHLTPTTTLHFDTVLNTKYLFLHSTLLK